MTDRNEAELQEDIPTPWSFRIMVVLVALYLGWRLVQGVVWLFQALGG